MAFTTALALFGILTLLMLGLEIFYTYGTQGFAFGFSSNRKLIEKTQMGLRIQRAYQNQIESTAYCLPVLVAAALLGLEGSGVEMAALLLVIGRASFAILYYSGISFIRVPAFLMSTLSTIYIAYSILSSGIIEL